MRFIHYIISLLIFGSFSFQGRAEIFRAGSVLKDAREQLSLGEFNKALKLSESVLTHSGNQLSKLEALSVAAQANRGLGLLNAADSCYAKTLRLTEQIYGPHTQDYLNALFNYAQFLMLSGRYEKSIELINDIDWAEIGDYKGKAQLLSIKASDLLYLGQPKEAVSVIDEALALEEDFKEIPEEGAVLYQNRAFFKLSDKDFAGAVDDYKKSLPLLSGKNRGAATASLALSLAYDNQIEQALDSIESALQILAPFGRYDEDYIIALRKRGEILNLAQRYDQGVEAMKEFVELERQRLKEILPSLTPQMRLDYWTKEKPNLSHAFYLGEADPNLAFDAALLRRQSTLLAGSENALIQKLDETSASLAKRLGEDEAAVAFILYEDNQDRLRNAAVSLDASGKAYFIDLFPQDSIYKFNPRLEASLLEATTISDHRYKNLLYGDTLLAKALWLPILESLPSNIKRVHFAPEGIFHLWGIENMPLPGKGDLRFIRHYSLAGLKDQEQKINEELPALVGGGFDFDAEPIGFESEDNNSVRGNTEAFEEILRNIDEENGAHIFQYLPGSRKEAARIAEITDSAILRNDLTEEEIKFSPLNYRIIHLATHGYALDAGLDVAARNERDSLGYDLTLWTSGLAFSGANVANGLDDREDGILSAREICDLDLSNTSLVVLSACETGLGKIHDENASGLIRALKNAGAQTIIASLWEVNDNSTVVFMTNFYEALNNGLSKSEAFYDAQNKTRSFVQERDHMRFSSAVLANRPDGNKVSRAPYAAPWYWAPFIIIDP